MHWALGKFSMVLRQPSTALAKVQNPETTSTMNHLRANATKLVRHQLQQQQSQQPHHHAVAITTRSMASGTRGARGHGWLQKYRAGLGGRHLQGRWHYRDIEELNAINDEVFGMNQLNVDANAPTEAYLDLAVGGEAPRRVVIELASAALPKTTENFRLLCQEPKEQSSSDGDDIALGYASTSVYKIEKAVGLCLGDILTNNGSGGRCHPSLGTPASPYSFGDEGHLISHTQPGIVTMTSPGVHRNDSRFLITTNDAPQLDGRFVAFGRVKEECMDVVLDISNGVFTKRGRPTVDVKVVGCGVL